MNVGCRPGGVQASGGWQVRRAVLITMGKSRQYLFGLLAPVGAWHDSRLRLRPRCMMMWSLVLVWLALFYVTSHESGHQVSGE